ncbi:MAG: SNF2-related protein [Actinomycetaceae bacterium]|nr:SNF2-related protein [Actinomycetaceae bacterium]
MDRTHIRALRHRASALAELIAPAQDLLNEVTRQAPEAHIGTHVTITAGPSDSLYLIDPGTIMWPEGLYTSIACAGAENDLTVFTHIAAPIRQLYHDSAKATSFFGSLFSTKAHKQALAAAEELDKQLNIPYLPDLERAIRTHLDHAHEARNIQNNAVPLFPGPHEYPDVYISAARQALAKGAGVENAETAEFNIFDRDYLSQAYRILTELNAAPFAKSKLAALANAHLDALHQEQAEELIAQMPVEELKTVTDERLRFSGIGAFGLNTVKDVLDAPIHTLLSVPGIGEQTAQRMKAAAQTLLSEAQKTASHRIGNNPSSAARNLVGTLHLYELTDTFSAEERTRQRRLHEYFAAFPGPVINHGDPFIAIKAGDIAYAQFIDDIAWATENAEKLLSRIPTHLRGSTADQASRAMAGNAWEDYQSRPAHYQSLLDSLLEKDTSSAATAGLDQSIIEAIRSLELDDSLLSGLFLRGYQNFGAKFIVVQEKVILGDEMGLGKTVQALAAAAHVAATTPNARILIVVPASLIVNWRRESEKFTALPTHIAHGPLKQHETKVWAKNGGILIATYEGTRSLHIPSPTMVIVDEAHMVKNPAAQRSQSVAKLIDQAQFAVLMTGTPMENRVNEFGQLVRYIQPTLTQSLSNGRDIKSSVLPSEFREAIAPVYLRRNQDDVLDELPEKVENLDWVSLSRADMAHYAQAIQSGNWMGARQAAMLAESPHSAKIERIREIIEDAKEDKKNVLIFSYFRNVLDRLHSEFVADSVGIINGDVPPAKRQELVDSLGTKGHILLSQIGAGGVGLNIQSAQVVILAEVQVKPSLEDQAIARAHRMGQTDIVHVHRIIGDDTIDERLLEMNAVKRDLFDQYARESDTAKVHDAIDVSEAQLAKQIITEERKRLGIDMSEGGGGADTSAAQ